MKRRTWLLLLLVGVIGLGVLGWRLFQTAGVRLRFIEFRDAGGERGAAFVLENGSGQDIVCSGPGAPSYHFRARNPTGLLIGEGPHNVPRQTVVLRPGERAQFVARLWVGLNQQSVKGPFETGVKFTTASRLSMRHWAQTLGIPRKYWPDAETIVWSEVVTP
jgi:hypothetical protein